MSEWSAVENITGNRVDMYFFKIGNVVSTVTANHVFRKGVYYTMEG